MVDQSVAIKIAKEFVNDCQLSGLNFSRVILFGSFAEGTARDDSDIDLLIVSKQFSENVFENLKLYGKINVRYPIIETHPITESAYNKENDFINNILKKSIEIL